MLKIENLNLDVPGFSLTDINMEVKKGEFFALIGPTGSGKSLLLETIMGLTLFNSGKIFLNGKDISLVPSEGRNLGIVYQDCALFPHLTVLDNIRYGLRYKKIGFDDEKERLSFIVENLNISHILHRFPGTLSGGEKQRVALARVLVLRPDAVLLDEPLSSLDPVFREEIKDLLKNLHRKFETTFIMVSHDFPEVMYLAERAAIIHNGRIVQQGPVEEIFNRPNSRFVANFLGIKNVFSAEVSGGRAMVGKLEIKLVTNNCFRTPNYISIRPEEIVPIDLGTNSYENRLSGVVKKITCHGFYFNVQIEVAGVVFEATWNRKDISEQGVAPGKQITIGFSRDAVHAFFDGH